MARMWISSFDFPSSASGIVVIKLPFALYPLHFSCSNKLLGPAVRVPGSRVFALGVLPPARPRFNFNPLVPSVASAVWCSCGRMDRRRRAVEVAAAVMVLLLLPIAPAGGARRVRLWIGFLTITALCKPSVLIITEPDIRNSGQSFVFNYTLAKAIVEYASAVYMTDLTALYTWTCSRCNDLTRGFEVTCIIVDVQNCLQAFVGVDPNLNAIIVAIRGTQENSIQNWIKDLIWKQVNLNYPNMPNAKVHIGFYSSYNNTLLRPAITNAVRKARKLHGDCDIIVTGHSMGGAIASFCALDLAISFGSDNVHLMSFGQPRVGNAAFASYFAKYVPKTIRMTHERDIVPHLPPYFFFLPQLTYRHFPREVWEHDVDGNTTFQVCDGSGEDPNCSRSVFVLFWSASDHLTYMGVKIEADDWSTCRIVLGQSVEQLGMSLASNIATSGHSVDVVIADHSVQVD
uniref:Fungal lipase-type domain-containing protein n=1 Tax=Setaria italica TaxID=4555 RepID=K4A9Q4_SETIT